LLMAVDPSFVFHTKLDWGPVVIMLLLKMSSLYVLAFWVQTQHARYLALGGFLLGLALYNEVTFIWYLAGMSLAVGVVFGKDFFRYLTVRAVAVFSLFFVLGSLPLIHFNLKKGWSTLKGQDYITWDKLYTIPEKLGWFRDTLN